MNNSRMSSYGLLKLKPTFNQIISENQFSEIIDVLNIDKKNTRIGCIGFFPSVANYNGLKTVGGYRSFYNLEFKNNFYKIIKDEITQNEELGGNFSSWGGRLYLYDNTFKRNLPITHKEIINIEPITTELNINELKKLDVNYLFSVAKIINATEKELKEVYVSNHTKYFYKFYIYAVL